MKKRPIVASAIFALENGLITAEDALRAALRPEFELWLERRLDRPDSQLARRPRFRRRSVLPKQVAAKAVRKTKRALRGVSEVLSVHWGTRQRNGRPTNEPAVVVFVPRKLSPREVSRDQRFPQTLEVRTKRGTHAVRIDVQGTGPPGRLYAPTIAMPGERASVVIGDGDDVTDGSLGALVEVPTLGLCAILSWHVVGAKGVKVRGRFAQLPLLDLGTVERLLTPPAGDAALTRPVDPQARNVLVSQARQVRDPSEQDLTFVVHVKVQREFAPKQSAIEGVGVTGHFVHDGAEIAIDGLTTLQPAVTVPGDSGAPVVDGSGNLVGFVVGEWNSRTFLMPARRAIDALV